MHQTETNLKRYLKEIIRAEISSERLVAIANHFTFMEVSKNELFLQEGQICRFFCFIESGILQHAIQVSGEEKTTYLGLKNTCTTALKSFKMKIPARKSIRALSDCKLWVLDFKSFDELFQINADFRKFYFNLIENQILLIDDYRIDLLTLTPEERYKKLLFNEPKYIQQVPLHYLASFLGISTRHMSRIRKNIN